LQRENGRAERPSISAAKLPVAGLRRQAATGVENFYPQFFAPVAGNLPSAQTMTAAPPQVLWHCLEAVATAAIPLGERTMPQGIPPPVLQVVSKCALREKKGRPPVYKGAHKTVILKITIMASVRRDWQRNNGYLVRAGYPLFFCCHEKQ